MIDVAAVGFARVVTRSVLAALALAALASTASPASAQDGATPAERFQRAVSRYEASQYEAALEDFQELYVESREPALLFNIARCQEQLGDLDAAAVSLRRYLEHIEASADRVDAERLLENVEQRRAARDDGVAPVEPPSTTEPPSTEPPPEPPPSADGLSSMSQAGIALLAVGGVALITGAIFGGLAAAEHGALSSSCGGACTEDEVSDLRAFGIAADVGIFGGGVIAAVGVVLLVLGLAERDDRHVARRSEVRF